MKKLITFTFFFFFTTTWLWAQYQDRFWVMGKANDPINTTNITFDFYSNNLSLYDVTSAPPTMNPEPNEITNTNGFEGWGVVTNPETGELLFYTDGEDVFSGNHQDITPSGGLGASASSSQAVAITIKPVCPFDQYYIFSNPTGVYGGGNTNGPVTYRTYTIGGGFSAITALPGPDGTKSVGEGMLVIPSKTDPFVFWLVVRLLAPTPNGSNYAVYRIGSSGISHQGTFSFGPAVTDNPYSPIMNMTYIDDGSTDDVLVGFSVSGSPNRVFVNRFNATTGVFEDDASELANFSEGTLYDLEFSPGGNYLYYASYFPSALYQVSVNGGASTQLRNFGNIRGGGLKRAPDGFVYHIYDAGVISSTGTVRIGRIVQADVAYNGSNFDAMYQADFNTSINMIYNNVFAYNFPEFAGVPSWSAELAMIGENPICTDGEVQITASINALGQTIDSYQWLYNESNFTTTTDPFLIVDQPGEYQVLIQIEGGCIIASNQITIEAANSPQIDNVILDATPCEMNNGSITVVASGGEAPLNYFLNGNLSNTGNIFDNLFPGVYTIEVQDQNNCVVSQEVEVLQEGNPPIIGSVDSQESTCLGNDGSITIQANGVNGTLEYSLDNTNYQSSNQFTELAAGNYTIFVRDENGCLSTSILELTQIDNGPQIIDLVSQPTSCNGNDGSISISAITDNGDLSYSIDGINFESEDLILGLDSGTYIVIAQDDLGCIVSEDILVSSTASFPFIESLQLHRPTCSTADGAITVQADGENKPLSYSIDGFNFQSDNRFNDLVDGSYTLYIQDTLGCRIDSSLILLENNCPVYIPNVFSPNSDGRNDRFQVFTNGDPNTIVLNYDIFGRWGEHIYSASNLLPTDYNLFWDGTFHGQKMGVGIYVYLVEIGYEDGEKIVLSGDVLLIR